MKDCMNCNNKNNLTKVITKSILEDTCPDCIGNAIIKMINYMKKNHPGYLLNLDTYIKDHEEKANEHNKERHRLIGIKKLFGVYKDV